MEKLFAAIRDSADGAFVTNFAGTIVYWNGAARDLLGFSAPDAVGRPCYKMLCGEDDCGQPVCHAACGIVERASSGQRVPSFDLHARCKSGRRRWLNVSILAFPVSERDQRRVVVHLLRDITARKAAERIGVEVTRLVSSVGAGYSADLEIPETEAPTVDELTNREREILALLAQGLGTDELSRTLHISRTTVRNHIANILAKLQVHSRLEAVALARRLGLLISTE